MAQKIQMGTNVSYAHLEKLFQSDGVPEGRYEKANIAPPNNICLAGHSTGRIRKEDVD
jgi:hypothetical protein